jgi:hypothetical protein
VNDAAVAGEHAAMHCGDDVTDGSDAILQRHSLRRSFNAVISGMVRWHQTRNLEIPGSMLRIAPE